MATKKIEQLTQAAEVYRECMLQIKELEKQVAPYKRMLIEHAKSVILPNIDLGAVSLEKRTTEKAVINKQAITPDWLWRMQDNGYGDLINIGLDARKIEKANCKELNDYLNEVGYEINESVSYAIRINP